MKAALLLSAIWLAGCARSSGDLAAGRPFFREAARELGVAFDHDPKLQGKFYLTEVMGSGVAMFDATTTATSICISCRDTLTAEPTSFSRIV